MGFIHIDEKASGASRATADAEIEQLLQGSYARAKQLLAGHKRELEIVAKGECVIITTTVQLLLRVTV